MGMNKREQAEMESLKQQLREAKALRFTEDVEPDLMPPDAWGELVKGWRFNKHNSAVSRGCTSSCLHGFCGDEVLNTRGAIRLYSTKLLCLRGLRHAKELDYAKSLAAIDKLIEEESQKGGSP